MGDVDGVNGAEVGSPPTISSPKVPVLGPDGKTRFVSRRLYEESAASPELSPKTPRFLYILDSGWVEKEAGTEFPQLSLSPSSTETTPTTAAAFFFSSSISR